jgi:hypothetical protein
VLKRKAETALLFMVKHTAAGNLRLLRIATAVNPQYTVAAVTVTRTPTLQTRRN